MRNKTIFRQTHYMTIELRGFAPQFNGHVVRLALNLLGLPRIIEMIHFFGHTMYKVKNSEKMR